MSKHYTAQPCPCGYRACKDWHVWPVAAVESVKFTEEQARAVANLLNVMAVAEEALQAKVNIRDLPDMS